MNGSSLALVSLAGLAAAGIARARGSRSLGRYRLADEHASGERDAAFRRLAEDQRGEPESAMDRLQHAQIAQEYGWLCEHVGDLTHRLAENFSWYGGGAVKEKVDKTRRALRNVTEFERHLQQQVENNVRYSAEPENIARRKPWMVSVEAAHAKLTSLGRAYADAHAALRVYNRVQAAARSAAVAVGHQDFDRAKAYLWQVEEALAKGHEHWIDTAVAYDPGYDEPATLSGRPGATRYETRR